MGSSWHQTEDICRSTYADGGDDGDADYVYMMVMMVMLMMIMRIPPLVLHDSGMMLMMLPI